MKLLINLLLVSLMAVVAVVPSLFATWSYTDSPMQEKHITVNSGLAVFYYKPEEILPGGDEENVQLGENHLELLNNILWHDSYGVNATKKPVIHDVLYEDGNVLYCTQNVQGGNLKHIMIEQSDNAEKLYFIMLRISATEYHLFTMVEAHLSNGVGTYITAYKTILVKENGEWNSTYSYEGRAKINAPKVVSRGIDVTTWEET